MRALEFTGNRAFSDGELARWVTTTPSARIRRLLRIPGFGTKRCLNRRYLARDIGDLALFYRNRGFYDVKVDTTVQPRGRAGVAVTFSIVEGEPTILTDYTVSGLDGVRDSALLVQSLRLRESRPFDLSLLIADVDSITRRLRNNGYYRATTLMNTHRSLDSLTMTAEVRVLPGKQARFGEPVFEIEPAEDRRQELPNRIVQRVMGIQPGALYSDAAIVDAQRSLYLLGIYRHVAMEPLPDSAQPPGDTTVVLNVRLSEDYMKGIDSEYGWATLDCFRVRLQYSDRNFLRSARRLEVTGQASKIGFGAPVASQASRDFCSLNGQGPLAEDQFSEDMHYFGGVTIRQPRLLGTRWVPALSLYSERRGEFKAYQRTTPVGSDLSFTRGLGEQSQLRLGYSQEYGRTEAPDAVLCALFNRCDETSRAAISERATLGIASATLSRFTTDNLVSPNRGTIFRAEARTSASPYLGTSRSLFFNKLSGEVAAYAPLGRGVFSVRLRAGAVAGSSLSDSLAYIPPQERLYAGGATSVRGFQQNELGAAVYVARTTDLDKGDTTATPVRYSVADTVGFERVVPVGGNTLVVANFELRVRDPFLFPNVLQYVFFVDGGDVWNRPTTPRLKWTPGLGLSAVTPIGPIQANLGYNAHPRSKGPIYSEDPLRIGTSISPLYCVTPGNTIDLERRDGVLQPPVGSGCPATYAPRAPTRWTQRLVFTLSLGSTF